MKYTECIEQNLLEYKEYLLANGKSHNTIISYLFDINIGLRFFYKIRKLTLSEFKNFTIWDLRELFAITINRSNQTRQRFVCSWKSFLQFNQMDTSKIILPRRDKKQSKPIHLRDIDQFLVIHNDTWVGYRNCALYTLLYATGLRISEALTLPRKSITNNFLYIVGKGQKERLIPILAIVKERINEYLDKIQDVFLECDMLFIGARGKPLSRQTAAQELKKFRRKHNLPNYITPHAFRNSFATHILESGGNLRHIQSMLGHVSLSTTSKYIEIADHQVERQFRNIIK